MKNLLTTSWVLIAVAFATSAIAAPGKTAADKPEDKSQKAWLAFKKKVEAEVEKEVEKMFKDEIVFMKSFKDRVFKVGDRVKVTRTIGRARTVEGLFRELNVIGNKKVKVDIGTLF